jgi:SAM-dependent methyltransferase
MRRVLARDLLVLAMARLRRKGTPSLSKSMNVGAHLRFVWSLARLRFRWEPAADGGPYQRRVYSDYPTYLKHQAGKLPRLDLTDYDRRYRDALRIRLEGVGHTFRGARVLCLGARIGTEVKAFLDLGAFAIGVDLNPGPTNQYVVHGDFHHLQYADASVDVVFSNSLDHVYDVSRWIAEVRRVLCPTGVLLLEVSRGLHEGGSPEFYESLCWNSIPELVTEFERRGFRLLHENQFAYPSEGCQLLLERVAPEPAAHSSDSQGDLGDRGEI